MSKWLNVLKFRDGPTSFKFEEYAFTGYFGLKYLDTLYEDDNFFAGKNIDKG